MIYGTRLLLACGPYVFLPTTKAALSSAHALLVLASLPPGSTWKKMSVQTQRVSAWGDKTTPSSLGSSRSFASSSKPVDVDPFREMVQGKTEPELGEIIQQKIQLGPNLAASAGEGKGEKEEEMVHLPMGLVQGPNIQLNTPCEPLFTGLV
eukprot:gene27281-4587_t